MTVLRTRLGALAAAFAATLALSSCTSPEQTAGGRTDHTHAAGAETGDQHNADDASFARNMLPHHEQALELVDLTRDRTTNAALLRLAGQIADAQGPEIAQMSDMLRNWGQDPDSSMNHGAHGATMPGMVDEATMRRLATLRGAEFDRLWLESMISHHQGAVEMAKAEIAHGQNPAAKELAAHIAATQEAEIGQMKQMLEGRNGS